LLRIVDDLGRRAPLDHLAGVHEDHSVGDFTREADLVRHDNHRHAGVGEAANDREHLPDELGIERRGRLVEQHQARPNGERASYRNPLLLTAGKTMRQVVGMPEQTDCCQEAPAKALRLAARDAVDPDRRLDHVLERGQMVEEIEMLKHHADACIGTGLGEARHRLQGVAAPLIADMAAIEQNLAPIN
jgi:hypothetical protein